MIMLRLLLGWFLTAVLAAFHADIVARTFCYDGTAIRLTTPERVLANRVAESTALLQQPSNVSQICNLLVFLEPADAVYYGNLCDSYFVTGVRAPFAHLVAGTLTQKFRDTSGFFPNSYIANYRPTFALFQWVGGLPGAQIGTLVGADQGLTRCQVTPNVIAFVNGVANTDKAATDSLDRLRREFTSEYNFAPLTYELLYNQTGCGTGAAGGLACIEDIFEVFGQRDRELQGVLANRWEIFWEILAVRHTQGSSLTGRLLSLLGDAGNGLLQLVDTTFNAMVNQLVAVTGRLLANPATVLNTASHAAKLQAYADSGQGILLVAHSQGNLFANAAFDALIASRPTATAKVVHVAPASPTLRGDYALADIDLVINGLRLSGVNSVPASNLALPVNRADLSGHMFEGTYLDATRAAYSRFRSMMASALNSM
jgi:hypothetical protein